VAPAEREAEKEKKRSEETGDQEGSEASVDTPSVDTPCINIIPPEREREQERADPASEQPTVASKIAVVPARAAGFISSAAVAVTGHATPHPVPAPAPAPPSGPSSTSTTTPVPVPVPGATVTAAIPVPVPVPGATVTAATLAHTSTLDLLTNTLLSELARLREAEEAVGRLRGEIFAKTAELAAKEAERDERRERLGLYERSIAEALVGLQVETARLEELRARLPAD
jgi:hypothetical protein